jgi:hypothetical protein
MKPAWPQVRLFSQLGWRWPGRLSASRFSLSFGYLKKSEELGFLGKQKARSKRKGPERIFQWAFPVPNRTGKSGEKPFARLSPGTASFSPLVEIS